MIPSAGGYFYDTCRRTDKIVYPVAASPLETHRRRRYPADGQPLEKSITHATSERCCGVARCNPQHLLRTTLSSDIKNSTARPNSGSRTRLRTIHNPSQTASRSVMRACKARCAAQFIMHGQAAQCSRDEFRAKSLWTGDFGSWLCCGSLIRSQLHYACRVTPCTETATVVAVGDCATGFNLSRSLLGLIARESTAIKLRRLI